MHILLLSWWFFCVKKSFRADNLNVPGIHTVERTRGFFLRKRISGSPSQGLSLLWGPWLSTRWSWRLNPRGTHNQRIIPICRVKQSAVDPEPLCTSLLSVPNGKSLPSSSPKPLLQPPKEIILRRRSGSHRVTSVQLPGSWVGADLFSACYKGCWVPWPELLSCGTIHRVHSCYLGPPGHMATLK